MLWMAEWADDDFEDRNGDSGFEISRGKNPFIEAGRQLTNQWQTEKNT